MGYHVKNVYFSFYTIWRFSCYFIVHIYVRSNDHSKMIQTSVAVASMISLFEIIGLFEKWIAGGGCFVEKNLQYSFILCFPIMSIYSFHIWYDHYNGEGKLTEYIRGGFISAYLRLPFQVLCVIAQKYRWCWVAVCICGFHCHRQSISCFALHSYGHSQMIWSRDTAQKDEIWSYLRNLCYPSN